MFSVKTEHFPKRTYIPGVLVNGWGGFIFSLDSLLEVSEPVCWATTEEARSQAVVYLCQVPGRKTDLKVVQKRLSSGSRQWGRSPVGTALSTEGTEEKPPEGG
jgi:hypothetical protein